MMKGFVNSLLAILISALLLEMLFYFQAYSIRSASSWNAIFLPKYADYYFDDVGYDLLALVPNNITMKRLNDTYVNITFSERPLRINYQERLGVYTEKFSAYAQRLNINASINTSNVTQNNESMRFSNGIFYSASYGNPYSTYLEVPLALEVDEYSIYFSTNFRRTSLDDFDYTAPLKPWDVYTIMNYSDGNGSYSSAGAMNVSLVPPRIFLFNATFVNNGQFMVRIQKTLSNNNSFYMVADGIPTASIRIETRIRNNGAYEVSAIIPIYLNITHFGYSKAAYITALRG